ncbi:hypothetical protein [Streptomyces gardneri]|uniref:hypothetical protein n=1 Tax=Streptomyces gardneri TaxID=66892 RepID=UPI0036AAEFC5
MQGQQFARLEAESLAPAGQMEKVCHAARLAAYLDHVAALDGGGRDFDRGSHGAAGYPSPHRSPPVVEVVRWHEQVQDSKITGMSTGATAGLACSHSWWEPMRHVLERYGAEARSFGTRVRWGVMA